MTADEIFNRAKGYYNDAMNLIEAMSVEVRKHVPNFSTQIAKNEFDVILECAFIDITAADGIFYPNELAFIEELTDNHTIISDINDRFGTNYSWSDLSNMSMNEFNNFKRAAYAIEDAAKKDFIKWFMVLDLENYLPIIDLSESEIKEYVEEYKVRLFVEQLNEQISGILVCCAYIDGDGSEREVAIAEKMVSEFSQQWFNSINNLISTYINEENKNAGTEFAGGKKN